MFELGLGRGDHRFEVPEVGRVDGDFGRDHDQPVRVPERYVELVQNFARARFSTPGYRSGQSHRSGAAHRRFPEHYARIHRDPSATIPSVTPARQSLPA